MKKILAMLISVIVSVSLAACANGMPKIPEYFLKSSNIAQLDNATQSVVSTADSEGEAKSPRAELKLSDWSYENLIPYTDNLLFAYDGNKYFLIDRNNIKLSAANFTKGPNVTGLIEQNSFDSISMYKQDNCFIAYINCSDGLVSSVLFNEKLEAIFSMLESEGYISDYKDGVVTITWNNGYMTYAKLEKSDLLLSLNKNSSGSSYVSPVSYGKIVNVSKSYVGKLIGGTDINSTTWTIDVAGERTVHETGHFAGLDIIYSESAINKEGWIYAYLGVVAPSLDDESDAVEEFVIADVGKGQNVVDITDELTPTAPAITAINSDSVTIPGFYNVKTGRFIQSPGIGMSEYVVEENGCNRCTVIDHFASIPVEFDKSGAPIYMIFDLAKEQFVDDSRYSHVQLMRNGKSMARRVNGQMIYLNEDMLPGSIDCDNLSSFVGDVAMITYKGSSYLVDSSFNVLSAPIECESYTPAASYYEFSPSFRTGTFVIKKDGLCHLAECQFILEE